MISLKHNFLFVHIPKTGGNSVQQALRDYSEDQIVCTAPFQDGVERFGLRNDRFSLQKHSALRDYRRELGEALFHRLFKFCCVRNPWERAISFYFSPHRGLTDWNRAAFIGLLTELVPSTAFVALDEHDVSQQSPFENVDFVMRFERLNADFRRVCDRIGIPFQELPVRNKSSREHFSRYYDPELADLVAQQFAHEIECFGYEFGQAT
jgi:hypothetical protein